jgi:rhodanese-related sulfurtransferase
MAFELYDRTMPFVDGSVKPAGTEPQMLVIYEGTRHPRMLDHLEFDVCELSIAYYLRAKSQGLPITAIPVFPRRLFGHSRLYINTTPGLRTIDVRAAGERAAAAIASSTHIPLQHLSTELKDVPKDTPLLVHCAGGYRSSIAASLLQRDGFSNVRELAGGLAAWEAVGLGTRGEEH